MKIQNKKTGIAVLILVTIEQAIKIVINNNFLTKNFLYCLLYYTLSLCSIGTIHGLILCCN